MPKDGVLPPFFQVLKQKSKVLEQFVIFLPFLGKIWTFYYQWMSKFSKSSEKLFKQPKYDWLGLELKISEAKCHLLPFSKSSKKVSKIVSKILCQKYLLSASR